jgi:large subunit ribosomal protein L30
MANIKITQTRSQIGCPERQKKTVVALGLGRIGKTNEVEDTPQVRGMIAKVTHLVTVEDA